MSRPDSTDSIRPAPAIRCLPVRTPTLPPATHTNVYVVGEGALAVVDPASPWADEQERLDGWLDDLAATGVGRVEEILLTHHHVDHVSGAAHLPARRAGAGGTGGRRARRRGGPGGGAGVPRLSGGSGAAQGLAARSLLAHLLKLRDEGRATERDGRWSA